MTRIVRGRGQRRSRRNRLTPKRRPKVFNASKVVLWIGGHRFEGLEDRKFIADQKQAPFERWHFNPPRVGPS